MVAKVEGNIFIISEDLLGFAFLSHLFTCIKMTPSKLRLLAVPRRLFCFGSLVILYVVCRYLSLFMLYININIGKNRS